jgi:hypothetical protein
MTGAYRIISRSIFALTLTLSVCASQAPAEVLQQSISNSDKGYFSSRGAYTGPPVDVIGPGVTTDAPIIDRVLTQSAVIPRVQEAIVHPPARLYEQLQRSVSGLRFRLLF